MGLITGRIAQLLRFAVQLVEPFATSVLIVAQNCFAYQEIGGGLKGRAKVLFFVPGGLQLLVGSNVRIRGWYRRAVNISLALRNANRYGFGPGRKSSAGGVPINIGAIFAWGLDTVLFGPARSV